MTWRFIAFVLFASAAFLAVLMLMAFGIAELLNRRTDPAGMSVAAVGSYVLMVWTLLRRRR